MKNPIWVAIALLCSHTSAMADWKCTMPNGRVIYKQLSGCPADAIAAEEIETVPSSVRPTYRGEYRPPSPAQATPPAQQTRPTPTQAARPGPPAAENNIIDDAHTICLMLRAVGATTCDVEVNILSASYIDATLPTTPRDARGVCEQVTRLTRKPGSSFAGRGWQLKLFSPYSDKRPMAICTL